MTNDTVVTRMGNDWYFATVQFIRNVYDRRLLMFKYIPIETLIEFDTDDEEEIQRPQICVDKDMYDYVPSSEIHIRR